MSNTLPKDQKAILFLRVPVETKDAVDELARKRGLPTTIFLRHLIARAIGEPHALGPDIP